jgi:omega-6 fatty acid desaturase (delta-12 desaturase)
MANGSATAAATPRSSLDDESRRILAATKLFARSDNLLGVLQAISTVSLMVGTLWLTTQVPLWATPLFVPILAGLFVRTFVIQHDCGHLSLLSKVWANDLLGTLLSFTTGVPYDAWKTEHHWHHSHQAKLSHRGIDSMNSPMTVAEAQANPKGAAKRVKTITMVNIWVLGCISLLVQRKSWNGFFQFRKTYRWPFQGRDRLKRGVVLTVAGHLVFQAGLVTMMGWTRWALVYLPALAVGGACGVYLFWVQHNYEKSWHVEEKDWRFIDVGLKGSSFLKMNPVFTWFSGHIGHHHVHHLNARIPNYRLEEARSSIPELAAIVPLSREDRMKSFTHVFWDPESKQMVSPAMFTSKVADELAAPPPAEASAPCAEVSAAAKVAV